MSKAFELHLGDCLDVLRSTPNGIYDAVVTDPPYGLVDPPRSVGGCYHRPRTEEEKAYRRGGFMGNKWDGAVPGVRFWRAALCVLKPAGYLLAFGGTRTFHRLACAIEDAGFEVRDTVCWLYGSGFPKGKGTLKPAWEPILLARKPGPKVLPLGIDECRVPTVPERPGTTPPSSVGGRRGSMSGRMDRVPYDDSKGRYPANVCHDGSDEVMEAFAAFGEKTTGKLQTKDKARGWSGSAGKVEWIGASGDTGTAARYFYCAKASRSERGEGNTHPTVKPAALMEWLVKLACPPGGTVLDPFAGSGTTGVACLQTGRKFVGIEIDPGYYEIAKGRLEEAAGCVRGG